MQVAETQKIEVSEMEEEAKALARYQLVLKEVRGCARRACTDNYTHLLYNYIIIITSITYQLVLSRRCAAAPGVIVRVLHDRMVRRGAPRGCAQPARLCGCLRTARWCGCGATG